MNPPPPNLRPAARKIPLGTGVVAFGWLVVGIGAMAFMITEAAAPGGAGVAPGSWPASSQVHRDNGRPTLVMFVHPHCPCSRATIGELALLMAQCQGEVTAQVLFLQPEQFTADWTRTDTWRSAEAIPGVAVQSDPAGREARLFGAETSGDTALYDGNGKLIFHGGITLSRGHSGDNPGRTALQALLHHEPTRQTTTPVFGCGLFECRNDTPNEP